MWPRRPEILFQLHVAASSQVTHPESSQAGGKDTRHHQKEPRAARATTSYISHLLGGSAEFTSFGQLRALSRKKDGDSTSASSAGSFARKVKYSASMLTGLAMTASIPSIPQTVPKLPFEAP